MCLDNLNFKQLVQNSDLTEEGTNWNLVMDKITEVLDKRDNSVTSKTSHTFGDLRALASQLAAPTKQ